VFGGLEWVAAGNGVGRSELYVNVG